MHITIRPKDKQQQKNKLLQKAKEITFSSSNCISMQIKNHMETRPRDYHEQTQKKKYIINKIIGNNNTQTHKTIRKEEKISRQTTVTSGFTSRQQSLERRRPISIQNPQKSVVLKQYVSELKNKNSAYPIKWRNPQSKITKNMRIVLGEWLMQVCQELQLPKNIIYNALHFVDKYVGIVSIQKNQYQQIGLCALFIASKLQLYSHPRLDTFLQTMDGTCTRQQLIKLQERMMIKLKFRLHPPTIYQYMILLVSLFSHFQDSHFMGFVNISKNSYLWNNIYWTLDLVHLQDRYKQFHNKEKVCLSILYMNIKKDRMRHIVNGNKKLLQQLETLSTGSEVQKNVGLFMQKLIKIPIKVTDLKQYIKVFKKWMKYEVKQGEQSYSLSEMKKILFQQV